MGQETTEVLTLEITGRKTTATYNGKQTEHKTSFLKKLSLSDIINYLK